LLIFGFQKKYQGDFHIIGKDGISMVGDIAMIIFQIPAGKRFPHFPNIFIMGLKKRSRRVQ